MLNIKSQTVELNTAPEELFQYLTDLNNYQEILPEKNISDFTSSNSSCSFKVQNIYTIGMELNSTEDHAIIHLKSTPNSPITFKLSIHISSNNDKTEVYIDSTAEVTGMLKMMVEKPLKNLFSEMAENLILVKG